MFRDGIGRGEPPEANGEDTLGLGPAALSAAGPEDEMTTAGEEVCSISAQRLERGSIEPIV